MREILKMLQSYTTKIKNYCYERFRNLIKIGEKHEKPVLENQKNTKNFTFQGIDELNQPFFLHAKKYQKIII